MDVRAAVIAGGKSSRFGRDKALLALGGRTLLERTVQVLRSVCAEVLVIGPEERARQVAGVAVIGDEQPGIGPLGAISTALHARPDSAILAVAVDMPYLNVALLRHLVGRSSAADVVLPIVDGRGQQLHAVYGQGCVQLIDTQIQAGDYKIDRFFPLVHVQPVHEDELRRFDPLLRSFWNVNTPEAWEIIRADLAVPDQPPSAG